MPPASVTAEADLEAPLVLAPRLAAGAYFWQACAQDRLTARLVLVAHSKIGVDLWWNRTGGASDVQLVLGLYGEAVELGSLRGNGFDAPRFHRQGFGTFAVNIAVQALHAACRPFLPVHGVLSNTAETALPAVQQQVLDGNRREFWRRFGLEVVTRGSPSLDYLRGKVESLRLVRDGLMAGQFPRCVALGDFSRERPQGF